MPFMRKRKFGKRSFGKRRFGKRNFGRRRFGKRKFSKPTVSRFGTTVVPDKVILKMRYCQSIQRDLLLPIDEYVFRGNSLFDPDFTGGGTQPLGFDQWANFYSKYRVNGSKITVLAVNTSSANNMFISLIPSLISTGVTTTADAISTPYSRYSFMSVLSSQPKTVLKSYMTTGKLSGQNVRYEDNYEAAMGANPVNVWYWIIDAQSNNGVSNLQYQIIVIITYYCTLFERIQFDQS